MKIKKIPKKIKVLAFLAGAGVSIYTGPIIDFNKNKETRKQDYLEQNIISSPENNIENSFYNNFSIDDYVDAIIQIESNGNPRASRHEPHLNDASYGLGQLLTSTAKDLEKKYPELPRLGETKKEIAKNLCNPEVNKEYTKKYFSELLKLYEEDPNAPELAVAAYNSGPYTPRYAKYQRLLNKSLENQAGSETIDEDGILGKMTRQKIKEFQAEYDLNCTGELNQETVHEMQRVVRDFKFNEYENKKGLIPANKYTLNHVKKFKKTLESFIK